MKSDRYFDNLPLGWDIISMKDATSIITDYVANGSFEDLAKHVNYLDTPDYAILIRLVDYRNNFSGPFVYINKESFDFLAKSELNGGELIIANVGENVGTVFQCPYLPIKMSLAPNAIMVNFKDGNLFYYYWLKSCYGRKLIKSIVSGCAQPKFNKTNFRELIIPHPSLSEQRSIAKVLSDIDSKIEMNKKINKELEVMAKELYEYWFVQFDFPNEEGKPYKSSGGKMTFNSILKRDIPEGWDVKKLGNLFETNRGVSYSTPTLSDSGTPMINLASFSPDNSYNEKGIKYFIGEYSIDKILKPYDLVMCNTQQTAINYATDIIGRSMLIPDIFDSVEIVSSHHVNTIKLENDIYKFWMNHLFNSEYFHRYIAYYASGTNIMGLSFNGVTDFEIAIPTEKLLKEFNKFAFDIEKKKSLIIRENNHLLQVRDELLPMLMNGQVSVK